MYRDIILRETGLVALDALKRTDNSLRGCLNTIERHVRWLETKNDNEIRLIVLDNNENTTEEIILNGKYGSLVRDFEVLYIYPVIEQYLELKKGEE